MRNVSRPLCSLSVTGEEGVLPPVALCIPRNFLDFSLFAEYRYNPLYTLIDSLCPSLFHSTAARRIYPLPKLKGNPLPFPPPQFEGRNLVRFLDVPSELKVINIKSSYLKQFNANDLQSRANDSK